jgi:hypothetical protein
VLLPFAKQLLGRPRTFYFAFGKAKVKRYAGRQSRGNPFPSLGLFLFPLLCNIEKQRKKVLGQGLLFLCFSFAFAFCKAKAKGKGKRTNQGQKSEGGDVGRNKNNYFIIKE